MSRYEIQREEDVFKGFFRVVRADLRYERPDGTMSEVVDRLSVERGDAAAILVQERSSKKLVLVRQFRYPTVRHGEPFPLEVVAGAMDEGESPEEAARRETREELGYEIAQLAKICEFYASPGGLSEKIHVFFAEVDASGRMNSAGGLEGEDVEIVQLTPDEAKNLLEQGEIRDVKALVALTWFFYQRHHA